MENGTQRLKPCEMRMRVYIKIDMKIVHVRSGFASAKQQSEGS